MGLFSVTGIGVTDTAGNTFVAAGTANASATSVGVIQMFYAKGIKGSATDVVSCNWTGSSTYDFTSVLQFDNASTTAPLDQTAQGFSTTNVTAVATGTFTTTAANEVLVGTETTNNTATFTAGSGYFIENLPPIAFLSGFDEYKIVSTTQTGVTASATQSPTGLFEMNAATFQLGAAASELAGPAKAAGPGKFD
jgi:hypothetical protein